jgi:hypothetical protein
MKKMNDYNYLHLQHACSCPSLEQEITRLHQNGERSPVTGPDMHFRGWPFEPGCGIKQA